MFQGVQKVTRRTAILILAYQRPDFLLNRLKEVAGMTEKNVIISVDSDYNRNSELRNRFNELKSLFPNYTWIFRERNLGLSKHIYTAVSEVLQDFENCVVIEDDVSVHELALKSLIERLSVRLPSDILTVGLFGGLPSIRNLEKLFQNRWRKTRYFSAWLWGIQREDWKGFSLEIVRDSPIDKREIFKLAVSRKTHLIWTYRLRKVELNPQFTWDYQMFFYGVIEGKKHLLPIMRAADNLGLGDPRATNTKHKKPFWYVGNRCNSSITPNPQLRSKVVSFLLQEIDAITWAGDSRLIPKLRNSSAIFKSLKSKTKNGFDFLFKLR